jgi:uncharacterized Ntn-hydrolase superfamily protein
MSLKGTVVGFLVLITVVLVPAAAGTFSIVAYDAEAQEWGIAVASRVLAAGYIVPWAEAGVGAIATQAYADLGYGVDGLPLLREGLPAEEVLKRLLEADEGSEQRQVAIIDAEGNVATFTGSGAPDWAGHRSGADYSVQGNILVGEEVLTEMERAYLDAEGPLAKRLIAALKAGDAAGGDKRGKESAAILVVREGGGYQGETDRMVDIRVDDHAEPVAEIERIYAIWEEKFLVATYVDSGRERDLGYALSIMDRVTAENPDNSVYFNAYGWYLAASGRMPEKALEFALRAHELEPECFNIMDTVAEAYYAGGDYDKAVAWEERALAADPGNEGFIKQLKKFEAAREGD